MSYDRYRYFKGESECPFDDNNKKTFWELERMYFHGFEEINNEHCWEGWAEDLAERYRSGELPDDPRVGRIMSYPPETLPVFCYISAMKGKWFPYEDDDWELDY